METDSAAKEVDLTLMWKKAVLAFCDATQQDYDEFLRRPSRQEIEDDIQDALKRDQKNIESQALENLGKGLLDVADVVVDAVSDVFTPVGICFKAVKLVFKLSAACRRSFSAKSLQKLLSSKCKEVMGTFAPYATEITPTVQAKIPKGIKSLLVQLMTHFMAICTQCATEAQSPKPKHLRGKISMYGQLVIRALAGGEASVRARAETLNDLLSQLKTQISSNMHTSMLKMELATEVISKQVLHQTEQIERQTSVTLDDSHQARIKEHLGFNDDEIRGYCRGTYKSLQDSTFLETGKWIKINKDLREWTDVGKSSSNIALALEGPNGSGKTHTCFWLLKSLIDQRKHSEGQASRANIAYFFFERPGDTRKTAGRTMAGISLRDALAGLVLQLTRNDVAFRTYVAKQCQLAGNTTYNGHGIFDDLIMGYCVAASKQPSGSANELESRDTTKASKVFFLLLDGLEMARGSQQDPEGTALVRHIIESIRRHQHQPSSTNVRRNHPVQLRFFISGTKEYLDKVLTRVSAEETISGVPRVPLCKYNSEDLKAFIEKDWKSAVSKLKQAKSRLDQSKSKMHQAKRNLEQRIPKLQPKHGSLDSSEEKVDIGQFRETLILESGNNYVKLQSYLEEIDRASDSQLESILSSDSLIEFHIIDSVRNSISVLTKELQEQRQEIDILNEILPWAVLSREGRPTVAQLEAVLRLKYGRVVDIKERIEQKYKSRSLLWCRDDLVFLSPNALEYFKKVCEAATDIPIASPGQHNNTKNSSRVIPYRAQQLDRNERLLPRDIMSPVSGGISFEKTGHDEPLNISFRRVDGHCRIILSLLKAVSPANTKIAKSLHDYAVNNILWHLSQVNPAEILTLGVERRRELGRWLFAFFMNENSVRVWFREERLSFILGDGWWESLDAVLRWFQDVEVAEGALSVLGTGGSSLILERKDLLERASEILASEWLLKSSWDAAKAFMRIVQLPKEIVDLEMSDQTRDRIRYDSDDNEGVTFEHVRAAERWAQTKLKEEKTKALRHTRIAETMVLYDTWQDVPSRCRKALEKDSRNWKAKWYLAQSMQRDNDHSGAMQELLELMKTFEDNPGIKKKYRSAFEDICKRFLDCAQDSDDEGSIQTFLKSFISDKPVSDPNLIAIALRQLKGSEYTTSIESFFRNLLERESGQGVIELLFRFAEDKAFHENLANKLRNTPDLLLQGYRRAIFQAHQEAQTADSLSESGLAHLRYYLAVALLYPRLSDSESRVTVARAMATDDLDQKFRSIEEARQVLQRSVNRWKRRGSPKEVGKIILGKTTRALGFAYVEWARAESMLKTRLAKTRLNDGLPKLELLKQQQDERLVEQDLRFATLVARTYRHLGKESLAKKHTRRVIETAFVILDDDIPDNDWEGYDILAQALVTLGRDEDALAAWFLVSQVVEDEEDNSRDIDDKYDPSKGDAVYMNRSVVNVITNRATGFDGDDDDKSNCTPLTDWIVDLLSTDLDDPGDTKTIVEFLKVVVPDDWPRSDDTYTYDANLMTWYYGVWLNDSYYEHNEEIFDNVLENIRDTAVECQYEGNSIICQKLDAHGDPDVFGRGMVATYFIAAGLATLYFIVISIGRLRSPRVAASSAQRSRIERVIEAFDESLDGFLDAALIFASAMLAATFTRFKGSLYSFGPAEADDTVVYPLIGSIVASILSVFICLTLQTVSSTVITTVTTQKAATARAPPMTQTTAEHTQQRLLRMFLWTFVVIFCFILETACVPVLELLIKLENGPSTLLGFSAVNFNPEGLWRIKCDSWKLVKTLRILITAGLGLQALNLIWYIKTLLAMASAYYCRRPSPPEWTSRISKRLAPYERTWTKVALASRRVMGTLCVIMMWVLVIFLYIYRRSFADVAPDSNEDSEWSFGQVLAMAQWVPTILAFINAYSSDGPHTSQAGKDNPQEKYTPVPGGQ
ncbi:hypothetical protein E8E14_001496 [Neopestalotiopsis sp. 37M]|nr:hypothetical protein E8E14_001496 [Neopestalotiopsis sp. 37M]